MADPHDLPAAVAAWLAEHGRHLSSSVHVGGGCINEARRLDLDDGTSCFLKTNRDLATDAFAAEAAGLQALGAVPGAPRVPLVHAHGEDFLLLEHLEAGPRDPGYWERFGRELATLHRAPQPAFGFACSTYCGSTLQPNEPTTDGHRFYAQQRFVFQVHLARDQGLADRTAVERVESFAARLPDLVPDQGPALLHGDLWSGNAHTAPDGAPALVDPACYHGWPEAELAMTRLFGGFAPAFYAAYQEAADDLAPDWADRVDLHNVYHLLNHANLFGGGYFAQAMAIVERYVG